MIRLFRDVLRLFPPGDALRLVGLTVMMAVSVLLELAGIGLIPMFLLLLTEPDRVSGLPVLSSVVERFGMPEPATLLVYGALGLIALFLVKNVYTVAFQYIFARFTFNRFTYLSEALFRRYMHAPYVYHLGRNSASLIRNISQEAYILIKDVFNAGLHLLMDSILILGVLILLLIVEPFITLAATSLMVLAAGGLLRLLRSRTQVYGKSVRRDRKRMIQAIQEGLGGFKDIRILARENWFIELFRESVRRYARAQVFKHMAGSLTRPVIETLAVAGMLLIVLLLHHQGRSMQSIVPLLVLFGAATLRVMPALSRAVSGYNSIRFSMHSVDAIREDMVALGLPPKRRGPPPSPMPFRNAIRFDSVRYAYVGAPSPAVQDVSFSIPKGQVVGIVGASGSGKTTLVNLLLGLMNPDAGRIAVDDSDIAGDLAAWRACIGYVPQDIFLLDASLKRNIAFGLPDEEIDPVRLESAIVAARLQEFVAGLPDGTDTLVGERGSRLSGGQRQRIGIARALYGMPSVLVLDEATSALDQETERHVVEAIEKLRGELTIVVVAHRLSTLRNCDVLVELKDGRVARQGTHRELFGAVSEEARSA